MVFQCHIVSWSPKANSEILIPLSNFKFWIDHHQKLCKPKTEACLWIGTVPVNLCYTNQQSWDFQGLLADCVDCVWRRAVVPRNFARLESASSILSPLIGILGSSNHSEQNSKVLRKLPLKQTGLLQLKQKQVTQARELWSFWLLLINFGNAASKSGKVQFVQANSSAHLNLGQSQRPFPAIFLRQFHSLHWAAVGQ